MEAKQESILIVNDVSRERSVPKPGQPSRKLELSWMILQNTRSLVTQILRGALLLLAFLDMLCYCPHERHVYWLSPGSPSQDGRQFLSLAMIFPSWRGVFTQLIRLSTSYSDLCTVSQGLLTFLRIYTGLREVLNNVFLLLGSFVCFLFVFSLLRSSTS